MNTGALLVEARQRAGLSRRELARRAGTSQATLSAYEHERVNPSVQVLERVLRAAGFVLEASLVSADDLERGRILEELLELAEAFPWRDPGQLEFPILAEALR
jgi:transcriptional regulator with XRE-family HTH domain